MLSPSSDRFWVSFFLTVPKAGSSSSAQEQANWDLIQEDSINNRRSMLQNLDNVEKMVAEKRAARAASGEAVPETEWKREEKMLKEAARIKAAVLGTSTAAETTDEEYDDEGGEDADEAADEEGEYEEGGEAEDDEYLEEEEEEEEGGAGQERAKIVSRQ